MGKRRNSNDYRKRRSPKKIRRFLSLFLIVVLVLFLANGVIKGQQFTKFLLTPVSQSPKIQKFFADNGHFDGKTKINVVVDGSPLLVVSFDPNNRTIKILSIPASTYTQVAGGYGWYPIGSAYGLGQLESPPAGGLTLLKTTSSFLGIPIDYYIKYEDGSKTGESSIRQLKDKLSGVGMLPLLFKAPNWIRNNMDTNLTLSEIYRLWWQARSIRLQSSDYVDVKAEILEELLLPDGSFGYTPKQDQLDLLTAKVFEDSKIHSERLSVEILNSTGVAGLASKTQRLLENLGVNVVNVSNYDTLLDKSTIVVNDPKNKDSYTVKRLQKALKLTISDTSYEQATAELTIILGKDQL